jgi:hypothetical protein
MRTDFVAHPPVERAAINGMGYTASKAPFEGQSTMKGDYVPHAIEPRPAPQHITGRQNLPFDGERVYLDCCT